jgi:hypothetical protein
MSAKQQNIKIYECDALIPHIDLETKERYKKWVKKRVEEILHIKNPSLRCKSCHAPVTLHRSHQLESPRPHVEHIANHPSVDNCPLGSRYKKVG